MEVTTSGQPVGRRSVFHSSSQDADIDDLADVILGSLRVGPVACEALRGHVTSFLVDGEPIVQAIQHDSALALLPQRQGIRVIRHEVSVPFVWPIASLDLEWLGPY